MDIRSFFQKKPPSSRKEAVTPAKRIILLCPIILVFMFVLSTAKRAEPEPTPSSRLETRRTSKRHVTTIDESDKEQETVGRKRKNPSKKKKTSVDSDSDFASSGNEMQSSNEKVTINKNDDKLTQVRKRMRRVDDDDEEMSEVESTMKPETRDNSVSLSSCGSVVGDMENTSGKQKDVLKKVPMPCSGCFDGKSFAFSGELENLPRNDAENLVKSCGGSVTKSITHSTKYLVIGTTLKQGGQVTEGTKYKEAVAKNVRILTQNEFYNLITEATAAQQSHDLAMEKNKLKKSEAVAAKVVGSGNQKLNTSINHQLWTDKYKPQALEDMIGNIELGKKLKTWLLDWEAVHVKGTKKIPFSTKLSENRGAKTVLLSGPPGIGKTTIANLVARDCGFECLELNASDTRSKNMLQTGLKDVLDTQALQFAQPTSKSKQKMHLARRVIIMDEVDGMSGGDRGGTAELILLIKKSKTPIICICNDRQSQKVRSLANHSFDLRMRRPTKIQIGKRLMEIGLKEGLRIEKNAIEEAADRCGNDIRQLLIQMQRWRLTTSNISYADLVNSSSQENKDESLRLNPFSATQRIFQRDLSFEARNEAYFVDYDLMPLMIQENYIQSIMNNRMSSDKNLKAAVYAAEFISESDLLNTYIRVDQRWDLLTKQAAMNVSACIYSAGFIGHPEFSSPLALGLPLCACRWLGKNSSASKSKRLLSELSVRMRSHASGSRDVIRLDYVPYMKEIVLQLLLSGEDNIKEVITLLDECEISREDLTESMESFKFNGVKRHSYSELDSKAKTAFTRMYNKASHKSQAVVESVLGSRTVKKGQGKAVPVIDEEDGLRPASDAESEPDEEVELDVSKFQKKSSGGVKRNTPAAKRKKATRKAPTKKRGN
ncbi:hypothetical protein PsorP6_016751 [Peronosclerospora sorghi]|uniref:Uncharacterized protein n=1 Tax=Peronosclerospora sorghi TaxID=230839 RepID=A0ACC0WFG3_9STRA|nr:hypothetical protein PsorP6_016751 [Peronosclerospora sorghi]